MNKPFTIERQFTTETKLTIAADEIRFKVGVKLKPEEEDSLVAKAKYIVSLVLQDHPLVKTLRGRFDSKSGYIQLGIKVGKKRYPIYSFSPCRGLKRTEHFERYANATTDTEN